MKIIAAFKTHFDIGYTRLASDVLKFYSEKMLDDVIETCNRTYDLGENRRYIWTMASWPLQKMLDNATPEKRAEAEKLIRRGQIVPHGLPFTTHTETLNREELSYGCKIAKRICKKYGIPVPVSAKMTDVPGHTSGLIDVLVENGIKFLHLGCNPASMPPKVPMLFWWEDLSGNRVLTMYNTVYGSDALPPKDWKYPVWLAMQQTYDNIGPQAADVIANLEREVDGHGELIVGTMDDFYYEISKCDLSDLPVIRGEIGDTWIHGIGSYPVELGLLRRTRDGLKKLRSCKGFDDEENLKKVEEIYENMLLFGEHTFGLDVRTYIGDNRRYDKAGFLEQRKEDRFKLIERSWDEERAYVRKAAEALKELEEKLGYVPETEEPCDSPFKAEVVGDGIAITLPSGETITIKYEYRQISFWKMSEFVRAYLQRMVHWGLSDFSRDNHPESAGEEFYGKIVGTKKDKNVLTVDFISDEKSYQEYGNAPTYRITVTCLADRVKVKLELKDKQASPMIEAGNMIFDCAVAGEKYLVTKCGQEIDPCEDIIECANNVLFAAERYAAIDNVAVNSLDSALVSFGGNGIFENSLKKFKKPEKQQIVFNLFNNQWGTNFPLYTEGDMCFEYEIMTLQTARETLPLAKSKDVIV